MKKEEKILYFQYILHKLLLWNSDVNKAANNDISILKSLKLLFFISAAKTSMDENDLLEEVFDSFWAMPYGHVESEVYDEVKNKKGDLKFFTLSTNSCVTKNDFDLDKLKSLLETEKIEMINEAIAALKKFNENLISYSPFDLVELSHQWYSWKNNYKLANKHGMRSQLIPKEDIRLESKFFKLTTI